MMKRFFRRWTRQRSFLNLSNQVSNKSVYGGGNENDNNRQYIEGRSIAGYSLKTEEQFDLEIPISPIHSNSNNNNINNNNTTITNNNNNKNSKKKNNQLKLRLVPHVIVPSESNEANDSNVSSVTWDSDVKYRHRRRRKKPASDAPQEQQHPPNTPPLSSQLAATSTLSPKSLASSSSDKNKSSYHFCPTAATSSSASSSSWSTACCSMASDTAILQSISEEIRLPSFQETLQNTNKFMSCMSGWQDVSPRNVCRTRKQDKQGNKRSLRTRHQQPSHSISQSNKSNHHGSNSFYQLGTSDSRTHGTGYYATTKSMDKSLFDSITVVDTSTDGDHDATGNSSAGGRSRSSRSHHRRLMPKLKLLQPPGKHFRRRLQQHQMRQLT